MDESTGLDDIWDDEAPEVEADAEATPDPEATLEAPEADAAPEAAPETAKPSPLSELLKAQGVTEEEFIAEVERQKALQAEQSAQTQQQERLRPQAEALLAQVEAGELTREEAEARFAQVLAADNQQLEATRSSARVAQLEGELAAMKMERAIDRIQAEFPGADIEILRDLAAAGMAEGKLRESAQKLHDKVAKAEADAIARYNAEKAQDAKTAQTPARGLPGRSGQQALGRDASFTDHWG